MTIHLRNPRLVEDAFPPPPVRELVGGVAARAARDVIRAWLGYESTPLRKLPALAARLRVGELWCKDESTRFGLGSFKALGGAYAVYRLLAEYVQTKRPGETLDVRGLATTEFRELTAPITVCAASAGNHGLSVAWAAHLFGCRCTIYLPAGTSPARVQPLEAHGATVIHVDGTYDVAVRRASDDAATNGWWLISDTADSADTETPLAVMRGYTVLAEEIVRGFADIPSPTHVFLQCGVGGLAAAVGAHLWEQWGESRPRLIVVEPATAACMHASARTGKPTVADGSLDTTMSCLACGEVSVPAWEVLSRAAHDFLVIPDQASHIAVRMLGDSDLADPPIPTTSSGAAGLGGLAAADADAGIREALGLRHDSRVLVIASEGAKTE